MNTPGCDLLVQQVLDRFGDTPDPRLRQILRSLVSHLHAFVRETRLTDREWMQGIEFLTATGQMCDAKRQEFILLSDVLGVSMQMVAVNSDRGEGTTEATVFGPFHVDSAPAYDNGADIANGATGAPCVVHGRVRGSDGSVIAGATVDVWQADEEGLYDVQRPGLTHAQARGVLRTDAEGRFGFRTVVPVPYPIPTDGPVGDLLRASRRPAVRPAHLHVMIAADGFQTLVTHVFRRGDAHLACDPVFGVRDSLVADWTTEPDGTVRLDFDFVLPPALEVKQP
jgi:hydroxyquinol 1,2-dioxygenase